MYDYDYFCRSTRISMKYNLLIFNLLFVFITGVSGQTFLVKGKVTDADTKEPLPYVNIGLKDHIRGTTTDLKGEYQFEISKGFSILIFSSVGFERATHRVDAGKEQVIRLDVALKPSSLELNTVVVAASKYEQKIQESITSIEVLKPSLVENSNITRIDKAIEKLPGVMIMDNEPQIRAGSGFSSGLGSRVMILVDEVPLLRMDANRPVWNFMPVDDIEQVEVLKGAASVIYGSSALNGAINVRTAWPADTSRTIGKIYSGIYSKPNRRYATPWSGFNPIMAGASMLHAQRVGYFDFIVGASYLDDQGFVGNIPEKAAQNLDNNTGEYSRHLKFYFNTRKRSKNIDGLNYGLNGNIMWDKSAEAFFWFDADTNIYRPYPGALTHFNDLMLYVDPFIKYYMPGGGVHNFRNRYMFTDANADNDQSSNCHSFYNEYQYQKKYKKFGDLILIAGIMNVYVIGTGKVFSGKLAPDSTTTLGESGYHTADNLAGYAQLEKKLFNRLNIILGFRWEYYKIGAFEDNRPVFRAGWNWRVATGTYLRASFGQGYRFPSIGERYITTNSGGFGFYPNPELESETSWNSEAGIKQLFKIGKFVGYADLAAFWQEYSNYVEFNFGLWGRNPDSKKNFGFKFFNTGDARILGLDFTIAGDGKISRMLELGILAGYTYSLPQTTQPDYVYYKWGVNVEGSYNKTSTDPSDKILKYRINHLGKLDVEVSYRRKISAGVGARYYSFMKNIDVFFNVTDETGLFKSGIKAYREKNDHGNVIFDCRVSYALKAFRFALLVNNIFNTELSLRPCNIESPRMTSIQVMYKI